MAALKVAVCIPQGVKAPSLATQTQLSLDSL